jgi:hypothetical protein
MTSLELAPARHAIDTFTRVACWDPIAETSMIMASPAAEPELFEEYHRGAVASYARFGVADAMDPDVGRCADDTAVFWALTDIDGELVGGVRAKGPLLSPDDSHAAVEWAGQHGETDLRRAIAEMVPLGVVELKGAWTVKEESGGRHRAKMIARCGFQAMAAFGLTYFMATSAAHILEQWRSSGGVVSNVPATPYPDERYQTKMIVWDRRTFTVHGDAEQVGAVFREMAQVRRGMQARREPGLATPTSPHANLPLAS